MRWPAGSIPLRVSKLPRPVATLEEESPERRVARSTPRRLETNGRLINRTTCLSTFNVPGPAPVPIPAQFMTLKIGCATVDAGAVLPNINDGFVGATPDLGAFELGQPLPTYGPRPATLPIAPTGLRIVR